MQELHYGNVLTANV